MTARDLEEMVDIVVPLQFLPDITGRNVGVAGGSGGSSVLAADLCEEAGLSVIRLPDEIRDELRRQNKAIWDWIGNPADSSISMDDDSSANAVISLMAEHPSFHMLILFVSGPWSLEDGKFAVDEHLKRYGLDALHGKPVVIVFGDRARGTGDDAVAHQQINEELLRRLTAESLPIYPNVRRAAVALGKMVDYYERRR